MPQYSILSWTVMGRRDTCLWLWDVLTRSEWLGEARCYNIMCSCATHRRKGPRNMTWWLPLSIEIKHSRRTCVCIDTQPAHKQNTHTLAQADTSMCIDDADPSMAALIVFSLWFFFSFYISILQIPCFFFPLSFFNPVIPVIALCDSKLQRIN